MTAFALTGQFRTPPNLSPPLTYAGKSPRRQIAMIKTQIQIPDHLYREAKRIAAEYEMSFAEVVRRDLPKLILFCGVTMRRSALSRLAKIQSRLHLGCFNFRNAGR